jgi:ABC-2 type transport system ATP-binding protein
VTNKQVGTFSRGMRQRLGLAEVLLKQPQLIIMDEPTLGLDPEAAHEFLDIIRNLKASDITFMLSSHLLHQVQAVCDRVGLFHKGRMVLEGTVPGLAQQVLGGAYRINLEADGAAQLEDALRQLSGVIEVKHTPPAHYNVEAKRDLRAEAARVVVERGGKLLSLNIEIPSLDEIYTRYFKQEAPYGIAAA